MSTERTRRGPARGMMGRPGGGHGPGGPGMMPGEKAKDFKGTFKKLLHYLGSYKWAVLVVLLFAAASTVLSALLVPFIVSWWAKKYGCPKFPKEAAS